MKEFKAKKEKEKKNDLKTVLQAVNPIMLVIINDYAKKGTDSIYGCSAIQYLVHTKSLNAYSVFTTSRYGWEAGHLPKCQHINAINQSKVQTFVPFQVFTRERNRRSSRNVSVSHMKMCWNWLISR